MNSVKMLTIDLLKGHGVPIRSNPDKIALISVALAIPTVIAIVMFGYYLKNNVIISIQQQRMLNYEKSINNMSQAQGLLQAYEKEKKYTDGCLSEVWQNIIKHAQWTPILVEIVKIMPDSILLKGIDIKQDTVKKTVPSKNAGGGDVEISIPIKTLRISVCEKSGLEHGRSIRNFQDSLRSSAVFASILDNITVSQGIDTFKGQDVVSYQINCSFKPKLR